MRQQGIAHLVFKESGRMGFPRATTMVNGYASIADKGWLLKKFFGVDMAKLIFPFFSIEQKAGNRVNKILGENAIIDGELARFYFFVSFQVLTCRLFPCSYISLPFR